MFIKAAIQFATVQPLISNTSQPGYNFAVAETVHDRCILTKNCCDLQHLLSAPSVWVGFPLSPDVSLSFVSLNVRILVHQNKTNCFPWTKY